MAYSIEIKVDEKRVSELLTGHAGRNSDWLHAAAGDTTQGFKVKFDRETEPEGAGSGLMTVGRNEIARGLQAMASGNPFQWAQFMQENDDDITFDVAWQFIVFGKEVYG